MFVDKLKLSFFAFKRRRQAKRFGCYRLADHAVGDVWIVLSVVQHFLYQRREHKHQSWSLVVSVCSYRFNCHEISLKLLFENFHADATSL
jgi:hypothetical protein